MTPLVISEWHPQFGASQFTIESTIMILQTSFTLIYDFIIQDCQLMVVNMFIIQPRVKLCPICLFVQTLWKFKFILSSSTQILWQNWATDKGKAALSPIFKKAIIVKKFWLYFSWHLQNTNNHLKNALQSNPGKSRCSLLRVIAVSHSCFALLGFLGDRFALDPVELCSLWNLEPGSRGYISFFFLPSLMLQTTRAVISSITKKRSNLLRISGPSPPP